MVHNTNKMVLWIWITIGIYMFFYQEYHWFYRVSCFMFLDMHTTTLDSLLGPFHTQGWRPVTITVYELIGWQGRDRQIHFTFEGEGLKACRQFHGWKIYVESFMKDHDNQTIVIGCHYYFNIMIVQH